MYLCREGGYQYHTSMVRARLQSERVRDDTPKQARDSSRRREVARRSVGTKRGPPVLEKDAKRARDADITSHASSQVRPRREMAPRPMASPETPPETRARGPPRRPGSRFAGLVARPLQALALPRALFGATPPRQRLFRARRVAPSLFPFDGTPVAVPSSGDLQRSQFGLERSHLLRDGRDDPRRGVGAKRHGRHRRRSERRQRHAPDGSDGSGAVRRRRIGGRARGGAAREGGGEARLWGEARRRAAKGKGSPRGIDRCSVRRVGRIRV